MFRFETQSFFDFLNHVIRVFFVVVVVLRGWGGGGHNRKLDSTLQYALLGAVTDAQIYCIFIYLFIYLFI